MSLFERVLIGTALAAAAVLACGPFFGVEVLPRRPEVLLAAPSFSFEAELKSLVPAPKDHLPVVESNASMLPEPGPTPAPDSDAETAAAHLYQGGATSFNSGQDEAAQALFRQVLALPANERRLRELRARFMLGRIALRGKRQSEAAAQFETIRSLVRAGSPDPLGLAVSSFGEQARGEWRSGNIAEAVNPYAEQASYGSGSGADSLLMIAGGILKDPGLLNRAIDDSRTRRLLFIVLNANSGRPFFIGPETYPNPAVINVAAAIEAHGLTQAAGAGLLASAAYSYGRFDLAQRFASLEDGPISSWVKAKLALRQGNLSSAFNEYDNALRTAHGDVTQLKSELGVLHVSRQEYTQALDLFLQPKSPGSGFQDYWGDAAYLAEQVLTVDELRRYVDQRLGSPSGATDQKSRMRSLLARRLMREGRFNNAFHYFDNQKTRGDAEAYAAATQKGKSWWRLRLTRAQADFAAAKFARQNGMEILGYEKEPDFAMWDGAFDGGLLQSQNTKQAQNIYISDEERRRVAASKPKYDVRYQYRITATDYATKAADLLPASSQPYAAVLCQATEWVIDRQPDRAREIYARYLQHGAYVSWGRHFGRSCPDPDFDELSDRRQAAHQLHRLLRHAHAHPLWTVLLTVLLLTLGWRVARFAKT